MLKYRPDVKHTHKKKFKDTPQLIIYYDYQVFSSLFNAREQRESRKRLED
jgi:hypothetical protein